jgi:predicted ATPase
VVEDLHWADQSTRDLLGFLARNLRGGVALVLTYRSDELHRHHPLRPYLAELDRSGRTERLELGRLDRRDLGGLLAGILGEPAPPALVGEILARSEGNPFFAEELLAAHQDGTRLPLALRELVLARVAALPEETQRVLQVAAVARRLVDHELLAEVAAQPPERLVELLGEAVTHHVLVAEGGSDAYAFRHTLVQEALYEDLLPVQRGPLHAAYARALAARIEGDGVGVAWARPSWGGWPTTGTPHTTRGGRCWPACRRGRPPRARSRWPRRCGTTSARWSCGSRRPRPPPAARWTAARCCSGPRGRRTWPAKARGRSP